MIRATSASVIRLGLALCAAALASLAGCTPAPSTGGPGRAPTASGDQEGDRLVPPGYGSLRQEEITLTLRPPGLRIKVTPLEEWIIRLTAPDTYQRLSSLARSHRAAATEREAGEPPTLVLVSFFGDEQGVEFQPEDLYLSNRGRRHAALRIRPLTGGWGTGRLEPRETQMAVYVFADAIDFELGLSVEYQAVRNDRWDRILQELQAELARARARARGRQSSSRSYLRSLR